MKKMCFYIVACLISATSWAGMPVPNGVYSGQGKLIRYADGSGFPYTVSYTFLNGAVTAQYNYPGGVTFVLPFTTTDTTYGQFNVSIEGQLAGTGYCIGISCHVNVSFPVGGVLESDALEFTWLGGFLIVSGKNATTNTSFQDIVHK